MGQHESVTRERVAALSMEEQVAAVTAIREEILWDEIKRRCLVEEDRFENVDSIMRSSGYQIETRIPRNAAEYLDVAKEIYESKKTVVNQLQIMLG